MLLQLELHQLFLSPYRKRRPLPWPSAEEIELIRELGFVDPVTARPIPHTEPPHYEILSGEKNWLAAQKAGLTRIAVMVLAEADDETAKRMQILQAHTDKHDPIQEARALQQQVQRGLSVTHVGSATGRSRTMASHLLRLLQLEPAVQQLISNGALSVGHAKVLVGLAPAVQIELANRIRRQQLTVRQTEALVRSIRQNQLDTAANALDAMGNLRARNADVERLETDLSALIGSPVSLDYSGDGSGRLTIAFSDLEVLDGLLDRLGYRRDID
ncbi:MAG: ParB/RepB/Spo0J family partition protein [Candidatus Competibacteraceae bacterium]